MYSICVSTNLYKGMFQGTKIHIIIQIPIIFPQKINKMMPEGPNSCIFSSKSLPPAVTQPSPNPARCIALDNTSQSHMQRVAKPHATRCKAPDNCVHQILIFHFYMKSFLGHRVTETQSFRFSLCLRVSVSKYALFLCTECDFALFLWSECDFALSLRRQRQHRQ